ncbi:uncharacterized protein [Typha latifolia]|uniref:uncharacterized protein n=1 Tax=Typha latifolia TaxID=4733 RepID=UPI003C2E23AC
MELAAISMPSFPFLEDLRRVGASNPKILRLMQELMESPASQPKLGSRDRQLLDREHIEVLADDRLRARLMDHFYSTLEARQEGTQRTYIWLTQSCTWANMKKAVTAHMKACEVCQQANTNSLRSVVLLQPLLIPE